MSSRNSRDWMRGKTPDGVEYRYRRATMRIYEGPNEMHLRAAWEIDAPGSDFSWNGMSRYEMWPEEKIGELVDRECERNRERRTRIKRNNRERARIEAANLGLFARANAESRNRIARWLGL